MLASTSRSDKTSALFGYLAVITRWLWLLGLCAVIAAGGAFTVSKKQSPVYRATTLLTINQQLPGQDAYSSLLASDQLVVTYEALISQPVVLARAAHQVGGVSATQLAQRVTVQDQPGTQIIQLSVDDTSPTRAAALANAVAAAFIAIHQESADAKLSSAEQQIEQQLNQIASQITSLSASIDALQAQDPKSPQLAALQQQLQTATARRDYLQTINSQLITQNLATRDTILVFQPAVPPLRPDHPNILTNTALAALLGLIVAVCLVFVLELLDNRMRTSKRVEEFTGLPALATVDAGDDGRLQLYGNGTTRVAESFETLRTKLSFQALERPLRTIVVTSPLPGKGKTAVAINLAAALARSGQRTLLVDADLHQPTIHRRLGLDNDAGLSLCLLDMERPRPITPSPAVPQLSILTAGPPPPNPAELLGSGRMRRFLDTMLVGAPGQGDPGTLVDVVVIDTPPAAACVDAAVLASQTDGAILVVDGSKSRAGPVLWTKDTLTRARARILGVVLVQTPRLWGGPYRLDSDGAPADEPGVIEAGSESAMAEQERQQVSEAIER
jgi:non-specific protein-tyrosine kinase